MRKTTNILVLLLASIQLSHQLEFESAWLESKGSTNATLCHGNAFKHRDAIGYAPDGQRMMKQGDSGSWEEVQGVSKKTHAHMHAHMDV